eukprot:TRINITY_DN10240_c0_g1_i1.p1 TRINITY_DN10240_c0_g1~~TRINITY_DN10240_c0_g1_i1.p1  ORF type:complete len:150 (-),score=43.94 TRINITY_DN10240_c0_g1_i1:64-513(-)
MADLKGFEDKLTELERKTIFVCYDGSTNSGKALGTAIFNMCSKSRKDRLLVCIVHQLDEQAKKLKAAAEAEIAAQRNLLGLDQEGCTFDIVIKDPGSTHGGRGQADDALAVAKAERASFIIVGAAERSKLGSFTERILKKAHCSVVVAR